MYRHIILLRPNVCDNYGLENYNELETGVREIGNVVPSLGLDAHCFPFRYQSYMDANHSLHAFVDLCLVDQCTVVRLRIGVF